MTIDMKDAVIIRIIHRCNCVNDYFKSRLLLFSAY